MEEIHFFTMMITLICHFFRAECFGAGLVSLSHAAVCAVIVREGRNLYVACLLPTSIFAFSLL